MTNPIEPDHYKFLGGIQPIDLAEHLSFNLGNVVEYVARAGRKGPALEDLIKARHYLNREIERCLVGSGEVLADPSEPSTAIIMGGDSNEAAEAIEVLARLKRLHTKGVASDEYRSSYPACNHCRNFHGEAEQWPCDTADAWM